MPDRLENALAGIASRKRWRASQSGSSSSSSSDMEEDGHEDDEITGSTSTSSNITVSAALSRARSTFTASSSGSSCSSSPLLPTAQDIVTYRALLFDLLLNEIPKRKKTIKGRFDKYDTARRDCISNVALPNLDYGKFPSDEDDRVLFMKWAGGDKPEGSTKAALGTFVKKYHRDPRSGKEALSLEEQRATFAAANANLDSFVTVDAPRRGAPIRYRFRRSTGAPNWDGFPGAAGFEGKTLHEVVNRNLKPTTGLFQSGLA